MTAVGQTSGRARPAAAARRRAWLAIATRPALAFAVLSLVFGGLIVALTPPLRGHDELAHVLRVYGLAGGDIVPSVRHEGKLVVALPADAYDDAMLFDHARHRAADPAFDYRTVFATWRAGSHRLTHREQDTVLVPYQGAEGYAPIAYLPEVAAAVAARAIGLDFVPTTYLMRLAGLVTMTAVAAAAIALAPALKWAFVLIAMLPAAIYARAIVGADGPALAFALMVTALSLRVALGRPVRVATRAVWMALCVLAKPSQIALIPVEMMAARGAWRAGWRHLAVIGPALALGPLWVLVSGGEVAGWRLDGVPAEQLDPAWKLRFMLDNPLHFPTALATTLWRDAGALWQQLVGVLGWLDNPLRGWVYPVLSVLLLTVPLERLGTGRRERLSLAAVAALTLVGYLVCVYLILFLTWTPVTVDQIWGVQGRYFVPVLPVAAIGLAALIDRAAPRGWTALAGLGGSVLAGAATLDAIVTQTWL